MDDNGDRIRQLLAAQGVNPQTQDTVMKVYGFWRANGDPGANSAAYAAALDNNLQQQQAFNYSINGPFGSVQR